MNAVPGQVDLDLHVQIPGLIFQHLLDDRHHGINVTLHIRQIVVEVLRAVIGSSDVGFHLIVGAELRRGIVQIAALSLLRERMHGYQLVKVLAAAGIETEEGTLYPLLRRLENQGLLSSQWDTGGARPRKYYLLSPDGEAALPILEQTWRHINDSVNAILQPGVATPAETSQ